MSTDLARRNMIAVLPGVLALSMLSSAVAQNPSSALDGYWEGQFESLSGQGISPPPSNPLVIRLLMRGDRASVFIQDEGAFQEVKPGTFFVRSEETNAVITSIQTDPGAARGASWVETWCFVATLWDLDTLSVTFVRTVNNNNMSAQMDGARFSQAHAGRLRRVFPNDV